MLVKIIPILLALGIALIGAFTSKNQSRKVMIALVILGSVGKRYIDASLR